jgi:hypothetical protein
LVITVEIDAVEFREFFPIVNVTTGDRSAFDVMVFNNWWQNRTGADRLVRVKRMP